MAANMAITRAAAPLAWQTVSEISLGPWLVPARNTPGVADSKEWRMGCLVR